MVNGMYTDTARIADRKYTDNLQSFQKQSLPSPITEFKIAVLATEALRLLSLVKRVENLTAILTHSTPAMLFLFCPPPVIPKFVPAGAGAEFLWPARRRLDDLFSTYRAVGVFWFPPVVAKPFLILLRERQPPARSGGRKAQLQAMENDNPFRDVQLLSNISTAHFAHPQFPYFLTFRQVSAAV